MDNTIISAKTLKATSGEVVYTLPSPEQMEKRGRYIEELRMKMSDIRSKLDDIRYDLRREGYSNDDGFTSDLRDVNAFMTAGISRLYDAVIVYPKWAAIKREKLSHPETYVIIEGFPPKLNG
jgi:hypothetical protein